MKQILTTLLLLTVCLPVAFADSLTFSPAAESANGKHIVLLAGDEEYRSEEALPMLGKILSQRHGFRCTVVFSMSNNGEDYIDPNNQKGLTGLDVLQSADLMILSLRFRSPLEEEAAEITAYLNSGKPIIGLRTSTHAFNGGGSFGSITYKEFGRKIMGESWVSHHGRHKSQGTRGVIVDGKADHPILNSVADVFAPSDVYSVVHLTESDNVLMNGAVTETLDPKSKILDGKINSPMQPLAWLHPWTSPDGKKAGTTFCTTAGAAVDLANEDLRRMVVNASLHLTGLTVPEKANVDYVDAYYPSFFGFIRAKGHFKNLGMKPADFDLGQTPHVPDPPGSPVWTFRDQPKK
ncbi:MAG: hypothetical protein ABJZ55_14925 [Fuerstiella sp.]